MTNTLSRAGIVAAMLLLGFAIYTLRAAKGDASAKSVDSRREVLAVDARRAQALVDRDWSLIERITADDYTHVETSGASRDKAGWLADLRAGKTRFRSFDIDRNDARVYGEVAILTGTYRNRVETAAGVQPEKRARHQRVYVRRSGTWYAVAHQATATATP